MNIRKSQFGFSLFEISLSLGVAVAIGGAAVSSFSTSKTLVLDQTAQMEKVQRGSNTAGMHPGCQLNADGTLTAVCMEDINTKR